MKMVCPVCRQPSKDALLVKCEQCKVPFVDETSLKLSLSKDELQLVANHILWSWKFWAPLSIGMLAAAWFVLQVIDYATGRRAQDVIKTISTDVSNRLEEASITMTNVIARRFEEPHIERLVRDVAGEQAISLMSKQIAPDVSKFKDEVAEQLKTVYVLVDKTRNLEAESKNHEAAIQKVLTDLQNSLVEVTNELAKATAMQKDLKEISDYVLLVAKSLGDDVVAWDTLGTKTIDPRYRFAKEARDVYLSVQNQFVGPVSPSFTVMQPEVASLAQKAEVPTLKSLCGKLGGSADAHLAHIIWTRDDLSKFQKLDVLAHIVEHTTSATARAMAGKHFAEESKQYFGHLRKQEWLDWWKNNRDRIEEESAKKKQ